MSGTQPGLLSPRVEAAAGGRGPLLGALCSLYIDMPLDQPGIAIGDWIVTEAGSRYLVVTARLVRPRRPRPARRWQMTVHRLPRHCAVPADVRAVELRWYRR